MIKEVLALKICLVGSLLPFEEFDEIVQRSKGKPSNAPVNFQMMLAKGICGAIGGLDVISFPTMAAYPNGPCIVYSKKNFEINSNIHIHCPRMVNVQGLKQRSIYHQTYRAVKKWIDDNKGDKKIVLVYSDYPPYADACRKACAGEGNTSCVLLMTDLPTYHLYEHKRNAYSLMMNRMDRKRIENYDKFDAYILLTKYMAAEMRVEGKKPYIVVEGFSDPAAYMFECEKANRPTLMYAGALSQVHNIRLLVDAFKRTSLDADLWIFGDGDQRDYILSSVKEDKRIRYFGKVSREELLKRQKQAHLLVSVKSTDDEHVKFAFPSKIMEYMTSGTAVLTTAVEGIPEEYFDYVYVVEDETAQGTAKRIEQVLSLPQEELANTGKRAREFVSNKKNCIVQGKRIVDFLEGL